jgi:hypothetical protein
VRHHPDEDLPDVAKPSGLLVPALVAAGVLLSLVLVGGTLLVLVVVNRPAPPPLDQVPTAKLPMTRDDFRKAVTGKTPKEVVRLLGKPADTSSSSGDDITRPNYQATWWYENVTVDPVSGNRDPIARVKFYEGKASPPEF